MRPMSRTRRSFLRAMGAGFAALPFARLLENSVAQAAGEELPLKFVGMYHPHGVSAEYWAMKTADTETAFDLTYENCSLQPFDDATTYGKSYKNKLLVLEGIDLMSNANGHSTGGTIFTGSRIDGGTQPKNISLDQYLAVTQKLGSATRVTSISLGVGNDSTEVGQTLSYAEGGAPLPKIIDPGKAFDLLFEGVTGGTASPEELAAAERKRKLGQSVIDYQKWDIQRLRARLAPPEQAKLDQHLQSLSELEKQLSGVSGGAVCQVPTRPDASKYPMLKQYNGGEPYFDAITDAHIDVLAHALACDLTRFATFLLNDLSYDGNPMGLPKDNHGSVAHTYNASPIGNNGHPGDGDPASWLPLAKFNKYSYSKVARLMQKLDEVGALDSTLIYASSDMGNPALHSTRNVPTILAGGANGKFRMGRRLRMAPDCPPENSWCAETDPQSKTVTNSKILVSIAQAFGVDVDSFGTQPDPALITGALSELT
jgi:hypothetical protein